MRESAQLTGGCLCGAVRYQLAEVVDAGFCHCSVCRRASGAPMAAWAEVPAAQFRIVRGEPREYASSERGVRAFCAVCGGRLYFLDAARTSYAVDLGSLDDPEAVRPQVHTCVDTQLSSVKLLDFLPSFGGTRRPPPDERAPRRGPADPSVSRTSPVTLREVTADNLMPLLLLDVAGGQRRYVAPNMLSIAQAAYDDGATPRAIYAGDTAVGFLLLEQLDEDDAGLPMAGDAFLVRFLVDERYQGLGVGRRALAAAARIAREWGARSLWTSAVLGRLGPRDFYLRHGFEDTGVDTDGERVLRRALS